MTGHVIQVAPFALLVTGMSLYAFGLRGKAAALATAVLFAVSAGLSYGLLPGVFVFTGTVTGAVLATR